MTHASARWKRGSGRRLLAMTKRIAALLIAIILLSGCQIFQHVNSGPCVEDSAGNCVPMASP
jgi:uncharacterized lipoprotein YajG